MSEHSVKLEHSGDCLRVIQITDTHLNRTEGGTLLGLNTDFSLQHVLSRVQSEHEQIDLVLGTGDISDHGSEEAYLRARNYFSQLGAPTLWLAGNHDRADTMAEVLGADGMLATVAQTDRWQIVMLNSQIPGEVGGRLGPAELESLEAYLAQAASKSLYSLVCLHHQPVAMGSAWIDQQMVEDGADFLALIDRYDCVKGVLWGHVHQQLDTARGQIKLMSAPSPRLQFAPSSDHFKVDNASPGYRWLNLLADGVIETGVSRVTDVAFDVDLESDGYL